MKKIIGILVASALVGIVTLGVLSFDTHSASAHPCNVPDPDQYGSYCPW